MRNELNEICLIDQYLFQQLPGEERRAFQANLLLDEAFAEKVETQRAAHRIVLLYARKKERSRMEAIYRQLLKEPDFTHQLQTIFP
jgi:hypothetical protein